MDAVPVPQSYIGAASVALSFFFTKYAWSQPSDVPLRNGCDGFCMSAKPRSLPSKIWLACYSTQELWWVWTFFRSKRFSTSVRCSAGALQSVPCFHLVHWSYATKCSHGRLLWMSQSMTPVTAPTLRNLQENPPSKRMSWATTCSYVA